MDRDDASAVNRTALVKKLHYISMSKNMETVGEGSLDKDLSETIRIRNDPETVTLELCDV